MRLSKIKLFLMFFALMAFIALPLSSAFHSTIKKELKVNINIANVSKLQSLPGVGLKTAKRIVDFRSKKGKFKKIQDLLKVKGIGEKKFEKLKGKITV